MICYDICSREFAKMRAQLDIDTPSRVYGYNLCEPFYDNDRNEIGQAFAPVLFYECLIELNKS